MILIERTTIPVTALPIPEFRTHLRLGTGFSDDAVQDPILETSLRAAIAQVESMCGKAVLRRQFLLTLVAWRDLGRQALPRAPVGEVGSLAIVDLEGGRHEIASNRFHVEADAHRPSIVARGFVLPSIPVGGRAEIDFEAGFGASWDDVPSDLARAVMTLAAALYEERSGDMPTVPPAVAALLAPYRQLRILGGGYR